MPKGERRYVVFLVIAGNEVQTPVRKRLARLPHHYSKVAFRPGHVMHYVKFLRTEIPSLCHCFMLQVQTNLRAHSTQLLSPVLPVLIPVHVPFVQAANLWRTCHWHGS